jgi:hypothetical protein
MRTFTVEHALAEAHKAGCVFRLAGASVEVRGLDKVPADTIVFLREHRAAVFAHLGGPEQDRPSLELFGRLGVVLVYCTDNATARGAVAEVIADRRSADCQRMRKCDESSLPRPATYWSVLTTRRWNCVRLRGCPRMPS